MSEASSTGNVELARLITIRAALKLETHGMRRSRGRSARTIANELMGTSIRTAAKTYEAFDAWLSETYGLERRPL